MADEEKAQDAARDEGNKLTRRDVLRLGMYGMIGVFTAQLGGGMLAMFWPSKVTGFGGTVDAGPISEYPPNTLKKIREGKFYLSRLENGNVMALYWKCTHLGCTVPWAPAEDKFHCPCHGSIYERTGQNIAGPAPRPLDYMQVTIQDGRIKVNTGIITQREKHKPEHETPVPG